MRAGSWEEVGGWAVKGDPKRKANRALGVQIRLDRSAPLQWWGESPG